MWTRSTPTTWWIIHRKDALEKLTLTPRHIPSKDSENGPRNATGKDLTASASNHLKDTVYDCALQRGGSPPAETAGLAGDKIVSVNGQLMAGTDLEKQFGVWQLRSAGIKVRVGIIRKAAKDPSSYYHHPAIKDSADSSTRVCHGDCHNTWLHQSQLRLQYLRRISSLLSQPAAGAAIRARPGKPRRLHDRATNMVDEFCSRDIVYTDGK